MTVVVGALIVTVAVICTAEVIRAFGFLNVLFGTRQLIAPGALVAASTPGRWSDMSCSSEETS